MGESQVMQEPLERLRRNATKCRDLASSAVTPAGRNVLSDLADRYEKEAALMEHKEARRPRRPAFKWSLT
jgi:hypothetical protein